MEHLNTLCVIVNPISGRGRVKKHWPAVEQALLSLSRPVEMLFTQGPGHAAELAAAYADKADVFVSVGGDGTAHEVVNGLARSSGTGVTKPLCIIPLGNGDDFVKMLPPETPVGQQAPDWRVAVEKLRYGQTAQFDLGKIDVLEADAASENGACRYFINGMNLGFTAHASYNFSTIPRFLTGSAGYLAAILKTLWKYPSLQLDVCFDDGPVERIETSMASIMNGRCFGHSFWVAPQAQANDGLLEVMITEKVSRGVILQKVPLMAKGKHVDDPLVRWRRIRSMHVSSPTPLIVEADGETLFLQARALQLTLLPGQLTMII